MNVTLFGHRVSADVIKDPEMRSAWITCMGPKPNDKHPFKREQKGPVKTEAETRGDAARS